MKCGADKCRKVTQGKIEHDRDRDRDIFRRSVTRMVLEK